MKAWFNPHQASTPRSAWLNLLALHPPLFAAWSMPLVAVFSSMSKSRAT